MEYIENKLAILLLKGGKGFQLCTKTQPGANNGKTAHLQISSLTKVEEENQLVSMI